MNLSSCSSIPPTICSSFSRKNGHPGCSSGCRLIGVYGMVGICWNNGHQSFGESNVFTFHVTRRHVRKMMVSEYTLITFLRPDLSWQKHCQLWTTAQGMTVGLLLNCRSMQRDDIWATPSLYRSGTRPRCSPTSCYLAKKIHLLEDLQPEQHGFGKGKRIEEHVLTAHSQLWKYLAPFVNYSLRSFENIRQGEFGSHAIWRNVFHDMYMYFVYTMRTAYTVTLQKKSTNILFDSCQFGIRKGVQEGCAVSSSLVCSILELFPPGNGSS